MSDFERTGVERGKVGDGVMCVEEGVHSPDLTPRRDPRQDDERVRGDVNRHYEASISTMKKRTILYLSLSLYPEFPLRTLRPTSYTLPL